MKKDDICQDALTVMGVLIVMTTGALILITDAL